MKVLLFLDVGGSMDEHVRVSSELFSAARTEFKHLEYFYFHNCLYERRVEGQPPRGARPRSRPSRCCAPTGRTTRLIFVGDATMSPYEITHPGGSVEHWNEEAGSVWLGRLTAHYRRAAWLNPGLEDTWRYIPSIGLVRQLMEGRMYPLSLSGLDDMTRELSR